MNIVQNIERIRVSRRLSEREMADILGISQQVYNNLKSGRTKKIPFSVVELAKQKLGIKDLADAEAVKNEFEDVVKDYVEAGYSKEPHLLNNKQMSTLLLLIASEVSFLSEERRKDKRYTADEARELIHAQMRKIEAVLV